MPDIRRVIIIIHGIRTTASWATDLRDKLEAKKEGTEVRIVNYGFYNLPQFLCPFSFCRRGPIKKVQKEFSAISARDDYDDPEIIVLAHSNGTYALAKFLEERIDIKVSRIILCGAVVSRDTNWGKIVRLNAQKKYGELSIINDYSIKDVWPLFGSKASFGYSDTGAAGIGGDVWDRRHAIPHSGYFEDGFAEKYWFPFIFKGDKIPSDPEIRDKKEAKWFYLLRAMPNLMASAMIAIPAILLTYLWDRDYFNQEKTLGIFSYSNNTDSAAFLNISLNGHKIKNGAPEKTIFFTRKTEGDTNIHFLYNEKFRKLDIKIHNRPIFFKHCSSGEEDVIPNNTGTTKYTINLRPFNRAGKSVDINFMYEPANKIESFEDNPFNQGKLNIKSNGMLSKSDIIVESVYHYPEYNKCSTEKTAYNEIISDGKVKYFDDIIKTESYTVDYGSKLGFLDTIIGIGRAFAGGGIFSRFEGSDKKLRYRSIRRYYESFDPRTRSITQAIVSKDKVLSTKLAKDMLDEYINGKVSPEVLAEMLTSLHANKSQPVVLADNDMKKVFALASDDSQKVRSSVQSYLRANGIAGPALAGRLQKFISENLPDLKKESPKGAASGNTKYYYTMLVLRDVHYNYGIARVRKYVDAVRTGQNGENEFDAAMASFNLGKKMYASAPEGFAASFVKNHYGAAYAEFERAISKDVIARIGGSVTREKVNDYIRKNRNQSVSSEKNNTATKKAFSEFLDLANKGPNKYPWAIHIKKAKQCLESKAIVYSCMYIKR